MITAAIGAILLAVLVFLGVNSLAQWSVDHWYLTDEAIRKRNDAVAERLRIVLSGEEINGADSARLEQWAAEDGMVTAVVFLPGQPYEVSWWGTQTLERQTDLAWSLKKEGYDFYQLSFADGDYTVALTENSELRMYDLGTYIAIIVSIAVLVVILLLYARWLTDRISTLSREVNEVSGGSLNHEIVPRYRDEISSLARDVENMRVAIIQRGLAEQSALQANHDLITALSHDIRNPLTALIGYLELLDMDREALPEADRDYVRACLDKSYRIRDLTGEMFRYFLVFGNASQSVEMEEYDAEVLLWQLLGECAEDLISKGFSLNTEALSTPCVLRTDVSLIKRVVDNLVSNITKYADPNMDVTISAEVQGDVVCVRFSNAIAAPRPGAVESNHIGLRTCDAIMRLLEGSFSSRTEGNRFLAEFCIPLAKTE